MPTVMTDYGKFGPFSTLSMTHMKNIIILPNIWHIDEIRGETWEQGAKSATLDFAF
jgi:hypothetical protein